MALYSEVYEYLRLHHGEVTYVELVKWVQSWYKVEKLDAEYFIDRLIIDYDQVFEFVPMHNEGKKRFPRIVRLVE